MSGTSQTNAIYFPEGAGYLLVKVLQTQYDSGNIESDVSLVRSLDDNNLYLRKTVEDSDKTPSWFPYKMELHRPFRLMPRVKDITTYMHSSGEYYWAICTEYCNGGDLRGLMEVYTTEEGLHVPEGLIWKLIADLVQILEFLQKHRISRRGIRLKNIFMRYPNEDDSWPDFVLADFGWNFSLDDFDDDYDCWGFFYTVLDLCDDGKGCPVEVCSCTIHNADISQELRRSLEDLLAAFNDFDVDKMQYLRSKLLPLAESKIREFRSHTVRPAVTESSSACKTNEKGKAWPAKIGEIPEDWQIVEIAKCGDGSGKLTIEGLARSTRDKTRDFSRFMRSTSGAIDLDLVYRFDAEGMPPPFPRYTSDSEDDSENDSENDSDDDSDEDSEDGWEDCSDEDSEDGWEDEASDDSDDDSDSEEEEDKANDISLRKKRRLDPESAQLAVLDEDEMAELEAADIDAGHPLLDEAITRVSLPPIEVAQDDAKKVDGGCAGSFSSRGILDVSLVSAGCVFAAAGLLALASLVV